NHHDSATLFRFAAPGKYPFCWPLTACARDTKILAITMTKSRWALALWGSVRSNMAGWSHFESCVRWGVLAFLLGSASGCSFSAQASGSARTGGEAGGQASASLDTAESAADAPVEPAQGPAI